MSDNNVCKQEKRNKKTKNLISEAFFELLDTKSFEKITVIDICDKALISRGTFYTHFDDKYHLISYCVDDLHNNFKNHCIEKRADKSNILDYYLNLLDTVFIFIDENKRYMHSIVKNSENKSILEAVHKTIADEIIEEFKVKVETDGPYPISVPVHMSAEFFAGGLVSLVKWWVVDPNNYPKEKVIESVKDMVRSYFLAY